MINKIVFKNYKSFKDKQELELKPITVLIGKNSSGKSAIAKLPVLIDNSLNNEIGEPYSIDYKNVQFGDDYRDVFFERLPNAILEFTLESSSGRCLIIKIISNFEKSTIPTIYGWKLNEELDLSYNPQDDTYIDSISKQEYKCKFDGFVLTSIQTQDGTKLAKDFYLKDISLNTDYIGPFRIYANHMRTFQLRTFKNIKTVGTAGENAYYILGIESLRADNQFIKRVSDWYKENFDGWGLNVNNDIPSFCKIELVREDRKFAVNIADAGQGMSQALPLIVNALRPDDNYLTIIEQPELHLHPAAHGNLAQLFAESAVEFGKHYLIETHSQNFVLRLRRLIAEGKFSHSDLKIYWVDYDGDSNTSCLKSIDVNEFGDVSFWPDNVFTETLDEAIALRTAQVQRKNGN